MLNLPVVTIVETEKMFHDRTICETLMLKMLDFKNVEYYVLLYHNYTFSWRTRSKYTACRGSSVFNLGMHTLLRQIESRVKFATVFIVTLEAKDLIDKILEPNVEKRLDVGAIKQHCWYKGGRLGLPVKWRREKIFIFNCLYITIILFLFTYTTYQSSLIYY